MAKLESSFKNMIISLGTIALVSAFLLSFVYSLTATPIENARNAKQQSAIKEVLPEFDRFNAPVVINGLNVFRAYKNNKFVGAAVESFSPNAFSGAIRVMVGFDSQGRVYNYMVLEQRETPGLGTKMVDWFKTDKNNQSIIKRNPSNSKFRIRQDGGDIDGITASTISSRAFIEAVIRAYYAFADKPEDPNALTGATGAVEGITGATNVDSKTGATTDSNTSATQQAEPKPETKLQLPPTKVIESIKQPTVVPEPKTDSISGATTKDSTTSATKTDGITSATNVDNTTGATNVDNTTGATQKDSVKNEIEEEIDNSSGATKAGE